MSLAAAHIHVTGIVQGVGYRDFCQRRATELQLTGWVRNQADGSVVLLAEGEKSGIEQLIAKLKSGPSSARVTAVDADWREPTGKYTEFAVTYY